MSAPLTVVACIDCGLFWRLGSDEPACADPSHTHRQFEVHRHLSTVSLPDGTEVIAASYDPGDPYARERVPDYGLYFDPIWQPPWPYDHLDWPDGGVPVEPAKFVGALSTVLARAQAGQKVEIGCLGGHGRTGTALAGLAVICGSPPGQAVAWVRANYCPSAVETIQQESFVQALHL
jgi:hypothetical protein